LNIQGRAGTFKPTKSWRVKGRAKKLSAHHAFAKTSVTIGRDSVLHGGWFNGLAGCGANYSNLHQKRNKRMKKRESLLTFLVP
jgi:hypothetical protein